AGWHPVQGLGVPSFTDRSGRGTWKLWSRRGSTTIYVRAGMWHVTQRAASESAVWWWCSGVSNLVGRWHCAHTALPDARSSRPCGSWQSAQVTPARNIRLWMNEATSINKKSAVLVGLTIPPSRTVARAMARCELRISRVRASAVLMPKCASRLCNAALISCRRASMAVTLSLLSFSLLTWLWLAIRSADVFEEVKEPTQKARGHH